MSYGPWSVAGSTLAHITGRMAWPAVTLFLAGMAASYGASRVWGPPYTAARRVGSVAFVAMAAGCFLLATILPIVFHVH